MQLQCYDDAISWCEKGLAVSFITSCIYVLFQLCRDSSECCYGIIIKSCAISLSYTLHAAKIPLSIIIGLQEAQQLWVWQLQDIYKRHNAFTGNCDSKNHRRGSIKPPSPLYCRGAMSCYLERNVDRNTIGKNGCKLISGNNREFEVQFFISLLCYLIISNGVMLLCLQYHLSTHQTNKTVCLLRSEDHPAFPKV